MICAIMIGCTSGCRRAAMQGVRGESQSSVDRDPREYRGPIAYSDPATETLFYAESNGRHVSAIRFDGNVLWTRDLYNDVRKALWTRERSDDAELDRRFRGDVKDRKIVSISRYDTRGAPETFDRRKVYLSIGFTSGDFGVADAADGKFIFLGRD